MEITSIRIVTTNKEGNLKAFASACFDECFVVNDFKIIETDKGVFVCMPAKKAQVVCAACGQKVDYGSRYCNMCGESVEILIGSIDRKRIRNDIAHPISAEFRAELVKAILAKYESVIGSSLMVG